MSGVADIWLSNLVIQSVVEAAYDVEFEPGDERWDLAKVSYYPVWSRDSRRSKFLLRIMLSFDGRGFKEVLEDDLAISGLAGIEDLYDTLYTCNIKKITPTL